MWRETFRVTYDAKVLRIGLEHFIGVRGDLILSAVLGFRPDMILVNKKPFGVANELKGVPELLGRRNRAPRLALLVLDQTF